jgi:serine/threonine-protein kinase
MHRHVSLDKSPEALAERATSIAHKFGYTDIPTDVTYEFTYDTAYLRYILQNDNSKDRWQQLRNSKAAPLTFTYSESPRYFEPYIDAVSIDDPPIPSNMATVILDTRGQLQKFVAAPPQVDQIPTSVIAPNWSVVLAEAGLDIANLKQVGSTWVPPVNSDSRLAWEGEYIGQPSLPIRVEAAAYRGRPVYFEIIEPWTRPHRMEQEQPLARTRILIVLAVALGLVVFCAALLFARHNLKLGRGDRKNAFKLALFVFVVHVLTWLFGDHHVFSIQGEFKSLMLTLAFSTFAAMFMWLIYIALEPSLRRQWPHRIISWNRFLAGKIRDPLVGRDILIGAFAGAILLLNRYVWNYLSQWLGNAPEMPLPVPLQAILGARFLASMFFVHLISALINPAIFMLLLLLLSRVLRRERLAIALFWVLAVVFEGLASTNIVTGMLYGAIAGTVFLIILIRFGLLAGMFAEFFLLLGILYPLTSDLSAWYSGATFFAVTIGLAVAIYGFYVSLAGQPLFKGGLLQD